jgi:hypothetical protein
MSNEFSVTEEYVREVLASLRAERVMSELGLSTSLHASSMIGVKASPSTVQVGTSQASA